MIPCEFCEELVLPTVKLCPNCGMVINIVPVAKMPALTPEVPRPPAGTMCLCLYGSDRKPRTYFPLTKDAVTIGRLDPVANSFPDIDLGEWLTPEQGRKISRAHAIVLVSRADQRITLRPLKGNTGTQLERELLPADVPVTLAPGQRLVLGGVAFLKFEIT